MRNNRHRLQPEKYSLRLRKKKNLVWKDISSLEQVSERLWNPCPWRSSKLNWTEHWTTQPKQHNLLKTALLWVGAKVGTCQGPVSPEVFYDRCTVPQKLPMHLNPANDASYRIFSATLDPLLYRHFCPIALWAFLWSLCSAKLNPHSLHQAPTRCKARCNSNISWPWFTTTATTQVLGSLCSPISSGAQFNPILSACLPHLTPVS